MQNESLYLVKDYGSNDVSLTYFHRSHESDIEVRSQFGPGEHSDIFVLRGREEVFEIRRETQSQDVGHIFVVGVQQVASFGIVHRYFSGTSAANVIPFFLFNSFYRFYADHLIIINGCNIVSLVFILYSILSDL